MNEGDRVAWTSQSQGYTKAKVGRIVAVIPAGRLPERTVFSTLYTGAGVGMARNHESYVVKCDAGDNGGRGGFYWPRANKLISVR
jgi:hypothetical protein